MDINIISWGFQLSMVGRKDFKLSGIAPLKVIQQWMQKYSIPVVHSKK